MFIGLHVFLQNRGEQDQNPYVETETPHELYLYYWVIFFAQTSIFDLDSAFRFKSLFYGWRVDKFRLEERETFFLLHF